MKKIFIFLSAVFFFTACVNKQKTPMLLDAKNFSAVVDGKNVALYNLKSGNGLYIQVTNLGGRVVTLWTPDKNKNYEDIVLGFNSIDQYLHNQSERFLGPVVGRYANRIANGQFELEGIVYNLPKNNNGQTLHGGLKGLDMVAWNVDSVTENEIRFSYISPDGEEGFPGTITFRMTYTLTPENEFEIMYNATTDKPTVINLSHHGLFNLKGEGNGTILDHILTINASATTPVNEVLIPTGELAPVDNTPFDFRKPTAIGDRIKVENEQMKNGTGYDHNWVIDKINDGVELTAVLREPRNGRVMEVWSDQPGLQFYSGNFLNGKLNGKYGKKHNYREALALENQKFPDSPNHPNFPSTRLNPGEKYTQTTIYKFYTE